MLKVGIVGLPNAGKSTLFNTLVSKHKATVASHPFTTINKNAGVVEIPDKTLFQLAKLENIGKVTPATIEFVDIAGLIKGAHQGEGLGNQFLHHIREVDLILHLVRYFKNKDIPHVHSEIDPENDVEIVNEELLFADLELLKKRADSPKINQEEKALIKKLISNLDKGIFASQIQLNDKELELSQPFNLLTAKKQIVVANIDESDIKNPPKYLKGRSLLTISAKLESELVELPWVEQQQFLKEYGLAKSAKENIIANCYQALAIITFYTIAKHQEARAWTLRQGKTALEAAAKVHTDFAQYFVNVEQIKAQELIKIGGWNKAQELGKIVVHGKDYLVKNSDVLEFKAAIK